MIYLGVQDDNIPDLSTTQFTALTPSTSCTTADSNGPDSYNAVPSPRHSYVIRMKNTDRAITFTRDGLRLQDTNRGHNASNRWLCVENGIFIGFYNEEARVFIGHDSHGTVGATATKLKDCERLSPRHHRRGGYELLSPDWGFGKRIIKAADDGTKVVRNEHAHTLWVFEECEKSDAAEFT